MLEKWTYKSRVPFSGWTGSETVRKPYPRLLLNHFVKPDNGVGSTAGEGGGMGPGFRDLVGVSAVDSGLLTGTLLGVRGLGCLGVKGVAVEAFESCENPSWENVTMDAPKPWW